MTRGSLEEAEALLLSLAERTTTQAVTVRLERAARSLFWSQSPGRPPIDDAAPIAAIAEMVQSGTRRSVAIRTVAARLGTSDADAERWRRKLRKNVFVQEHGS